MDRNWLAGYNQTKKFSILSSYQWHKCPGWKPTLPHLRGKTATRHWKVHSSSQSGVSPPIQIWWALFFSMGWWQKLRHKKNSEKVAKIDNLDCESNIIPPFSGRTQLSLADKKDVQLNFSCHLWRRLAIQAMEVASKCLSFSLNMQKRTQSYSSWLRTLSTR